MHTINKSFYITLLLSMVLLSCSNDKQLDDAQHSEMQKEYNQVYSRCANELKEIRLKYSDDYQQKQNFVDVDEWDLLDDDELDWISQKMISGAIEKITTNSNNTNEESNKVQSMIDVEQKKDTQKDPINADADTESSQMFVQNNVDQNDFSNGLIQKNSVFPAGSLFFITDRDVVLGSDDADIVVIEYSSFSCYHCSYYHEKFFEKINTNYIKTNKIKYVMREVIMNSQDLHSTILARCGNKLYDTNLYLTIRNILFEKQNNWAYNRDFRDILTNIGQIAGISQEQYEECTNDKEMTTFLIERTKELDKFPGFKGTPFFVLNNQPINKSFNKIYEAIQSAVENQEKNQ